jgi:phosphoenolpyruvate-protein phosphotransferase (PTS system enzyme I)
MSELVQGLGVSPGVAIGPALVLGDAAAPVRESGTPEEEQAAFVQAVAISAEALQHLVDGMRARGLDEQAGIMEAQSLMLQDPGFEAMVSEAIATRSPAPDAVRAAGEHFAGTFEALDDPYMAARAADVRDVTGRLIAVLNGRASMLQLSEPSVVVAHELTPSQTAGLDRAMVLGFATDTGSSTSHTAILARALDIPAVVGLTSVSTRVHTGQQLALDGERGTVLIDPTEVDRQEYTARAESLWRGRARLLASRDEPPETRDGRLLTLAANIGSPDDLPGALEVGAEGVGLFRTEFLFAGRSDMPSEDEQRQAYRRVLEAMAEHRVVVRTLDIGGDKPLPYLPSMQEANPFLGRRGIRYTTAYPDLLRTQLRALLSASPAGRLSIMLPMVSDLAEIEETRQVMADLQGDLGGEAELGIMIEVPAAALSAEQFARHVAFFSAGTNDLTQYTLAVDRGNETVAHLYQPLHPAVLRLLELTVNGAHAHGRWAGVCGEMAGDLAAIPILIGLGFDELSMTPSRIPAARERIRSLDYALCRKLAADALNCGTAVEVEDLIREQVGGRHG